MRRFVMIILSVVLTSAPATAGSAAGRPGAGSELSEQIASEAAGGDSETQADIDQAAEIAGAQPSAIVQKTTWALLCVVLLSAGLVLSRETLVGKVPRFGSLVGALAPYAAKIGAAAVLVALVDFGLDLLAVRPIVGDGIPQILALGGGLLLVRSSIGRAPNAAAVLEKHQDKLDRLEGKRQIVGIACLAGGVVHLVLPAMPLV